MTLNWLFDSAAAGYTLPEANYVVKKKPTDGLGNGGAKATTTSTPSSSRAEGISV